MLVSCVSGTYNRLDYLQRMIASVRMQMPRHLPFEFVIVDGGSADGTQRWCLEQEDIVLIEHGELRGAIPAFCDGAQAAQGDYVVMANDDVVFHDGAILRAVAHLEDHRACGAVAFADDRAAKVHEDGGGHRVMGMPAIAVDGGLTWVPYAQVGLFRRWLGDAVGWWGAEDGIMGTANTYGGDNYLSARIWELGYSVDVVDGCAVDDLIPRDDLRVHNDRHGRSDSARYYQRFPRGPQLQPAPQVANPQRGRLRALLLDIHDPYLPASRAGEAGLAEALAGVGLTWEIDYVNEPYDLVEAIRTWRPHLMLTQLHDTARIGAETLNAARAEAPDMVVVNWNGDAHEEGLLAEDILETLGVVDLQTVVNAAVLPDYAEAGIPAAYWQIGYKDPAAPYPGAVPAHDVLFLGNCYSDRRYALVEALRATGCEVGVYGNCPEADGFTHYDFAQSRALYERCMVAVSDTFPGTEAFVSNRLFQALSAGSFVLQERSPGLDDYTGLRAGEHYVEWADFDELKALAVEWTNPKRADERARIAAQGREYVRANFSYDAQVAKLWELLPDG